MLVRNCIHRSAAFIVFCKRNHTMKKHLKKRRDKFSYSPRAYYFKIQPYTDSVPLGNPKMLTESCPFK